MVTNCTVMNQCNIDAQSLLDSIIMHHDLGLCKVTDVVLAGKQDAEGKNVCHTIECFLFCCISLYCAVL